MGTYSAGEFIELFGGLPSRGEAYPDLDMLRDQADDGALYAGQPDVPANEIPEPDDAAAMMPHVFGQTNGGE